MKLMQQQINGTKRVIAISVLLSATFVAAQSVKQNDKADEGASPPGFAHIGPQTPRANRDIGREVQMDTYFNSDDAGIPLVVIADALKKDAAAARYRVSWHILFPNLQYDGTAVYDREERSIKLYEFVSDQNGRGASHTLFTKVTDDLLIKLAADYEAGKYKNGDTSMDSILPQLGCNTYELSR